MSTVSDEKSYLDVLPADDPFYYGWRDVYIELPDGMHRHEMVPLTLRDFLHPQEGDHFVDGDLHHFVREYLYFVFNARLANDPEARVFADLGVYWDIPELGHNCPDVSVFLGVEDAKMKSFDSFDVAKEGVRPRLVVEVVSPRTRKVDVVDKFEIFHELAIPNFIILDRKRTDDPWSLIGYQFTPSEYLPMPKDYRGWLWLDAVGVYLGTEGQKVRCYDSAGVEIPDYVKQGQDLKEERGKREQAEERLRELEAEIAKLRGNQTP